MGPALFPSRWGLLTLALSLGGLGGIAQAQTAAPQAIVAIRLTDNAVVPLEASFDAPVWNRAPIYNAFVERWPVTGATPPQETTVRVLYDDQALYVGIEALDDDPNSIRAPLVRHDAVNRTQDFVAVYIDPLGKRQSAQFFRVSASGGTGDGVHTAADDNEDLTPDFDYFAIAKIHARGYNALLRIPFASLRFANGETQSWRIFVIRRLPRKQFHLLTSALVPEGAPSYISTMQELQGIMLPHETGALTIRPSMTIRSIRSQSASSAERQQELDAGVDVKWRPRADLIVDATVNPDFSQVELDVPQLSRNTRFALSIAEKRPFFLESSDLLRSPTDALYTRSFTQPRWGVRATYRGNTSAATVFAVNDKGGGQTLIPGPYGTEIVEQPSFLSLSGRVQGDLRSWQLGGVVSARRYTQDGGDNVVLGPDFVWSLSDSIRARAQWLHSYTTALQTSDGTLAKAPGMSGNRAYLQVIRQTNRSLTETVLDSVSGGFRHDGGFVAQSDFDRLKLSHLEIWRPGGLVNEVSAGVLVNHSRDRETGRVISREFVPTVTLLAAHDIRWTVDYHGWNYLRTSRTGELLRERYLYTVFSGVPANWLPVLLLEVAYGSLADVVADKTRPGGRVRVVSRVRLFNKLEVESSLSVAWLDETGSRISKESVGRLLAVANFDPQNSLRALVQKTDFERVAESGISAEHALRVITSLTYGRRLSPGSVLYVGASRLRSGVSVLSRQTEGFIKWQFDIGEILQAH